MTCSLNYSGGQKSPMGSVTVHNVQPPRQNSASAMMQNGNVHNGNRNGSYAHNNKPPMQRAQTVGASPNSQDDGPRKFSLFNNAIELARKSSNSYIPDTFKLPFELSFEVYFCILRIELTG